MISFIEIHGFYYALLWIHDMRIQITDLWIRIRILLFKQVAEMPTKNKFFFKVFLLIHQSSKIKVKKKSQNSKIKDFLTFFLLMVGMLISMSCLFYGWEVVGEKNTLRPPPPQPPAVGGGD
jgi:hypothetical protein